MIMCTTRPIKNKVHELVMMKTWFLGYNWTYLNSNQTKPIVKFIRTAYALKYFIKSLTLKPFSQKDNKNT